MNYPQQLTNTYEILEQIGEGGGGVVYRAIHKRLQKEVVLKRIKGSGSLLDFRTEVDILKKLRHSYLPQVLDFLDTPEGVYTVMDFIPGKSLQKMLDEGHKFTEKEVLKYARQLCEALDYLHSQKTPVIHGDIKPDNIMITPEDNVCLIDFNISGNMTGNGAQVFGYTPGYSSPEQVKAFDELRLKMTVPTAVPVKVEQGVKKGNRNNNPTIPLEEVKSDSEATVLLGSENADSKATELIYWQEANGEVKVLQDGDEIDETVLLGSENADPSLTVLEERKAAGTGKQKFDADVMVCIDKRSDIYSLGATLYALMTGRILKPSKRRLNISDISSGFLAVLSKAVAVKPEKRYADAGKMLQALLNVHKKDKKYRRLLHRQELTLVFWFAVLAGSMFCVAEGVRTLEREKEDRYELLVEQMEEGIIQGLTNEAFDEFYSEAITLYDSRLDAYYTRAYYLHTKEAYEEVLVHIDETLKKPLTGEEEQRGNLYYLYGDCFFRLGDYSRAAFNYERALNYTANNPTLYRDYAVSLVYQDKLEEAEDILNRAVEYGLEQEDVLLVQGEIERILNNFGKALECFEGVLEKTEDEYIRQRAYIMASKTFEAWGTKEALLTDTEWLSHAETELSMNNRLLIFERLVQDYIKLGEMTGENLYYSKAVDTLQKIMSMGWDTYLTYSNAIVLSQRIGNLEMAEEFGVQMQKHYPEHYVTYMRLCYLEEAKQKQKENEDRDYSVFEEYYQKAKECYRKQTSGNVTDAEMQLLDNVYQQIEDGGWFN